MSDRVYDLGERLLAFGVEIIRLSEALPKSRAGNHLGDQLLRSGTSPALNHGEAQAAESQRDFIHKMRICLKELRETERCLKLIRNVPLLESDKHLEKILQENDELIRIFVSSIRTAGSNKVRDPQAPYISGEKFVDANGNSA